MERRERRKEERWSRRNRSVSPLFVSLLFLNVDFDTLQRRKPPPKVVVARGLAIFSKNTNSKACLCKELRNDSVADADEAANSRIKDIV